MKKVAILTLSGNNNYGNKLQNYALQETIKKYGFEVDTIWNNDSNNYSLKKRYSIFKYYIKKSLMTKKNCFLIQKKREKQFIEFSKKYINYSKFTLSSKNKTFEEMDNYDFFVVGSDQVWNYNDSSFSNIYFLNFSKDKNKNISYAASFGLDKIEKKIDFYKKELQNFKYISVREINAKKILESWKIKSTIVLDPTMLLTKKEWESKFPFHNDEEKKYIVVYFLGEDYEIKEKIKRFADLNKLKIINLLDIKSQYYITNPIDFLNLIYFSEMVFTDSFHATVFSIIFNKKMVCFNKKSLSNNITNSRIDDLLISLNLEDRKYDNNQDFDYYYDKPIINVDGKINRLIYESEKFLQKALLNKELE